MNVVTRLRIMRIEDFLGWEARQETRWEFDGYEPVEMTGGSINHARMQRNLALAIGARLRGGSCEFLGSDVKVLMGTRVRYPDGQVVCGAVDGEATFSTTPTVVFEVLSPSTERTDTVDKVGEYLGIGSVRRYVVLAQDAVAATVHVPGGAAVTLGAGDVLEMPEIGIVVPVLELYEGVAVG